MISRSVVNRVTLRWWPAEPRRHPPADRVRADAVNKFTSYDRPSADGGTVVGGIDEERASGICPTRSPADGVPDGP